MRDIRVGVVQLPSTVGEHDRNLERIADVAHDAVGEGVELLCFPELAISGYAPGWDGFAPEAIPGPSSRRLERIAERTGVTLLVGLLEQGADGHIYDAQLVVRPDGLAGSQRKTHVPESESRGFEPGDSIATFEHPAIRFGIGVCYDAHYPELCSTLVGMGAELLLFPTASGGTETHDEKLERWSRFIPARAYDNSVFVAVCNQVGPNGLDRDFEGGCLIIDPLGRVMARSSGPVEELVVATLTLRDLEDARATLDGDYRRYRRPDLYRLDDA